MIEELNLETTDEKEEKASLVGNPVKHYKYQKYDVGLKDFF